MSNLYGTRRYAIEGANAAKVYEAVVDSFIYRNYPGSLTLDYREADGVLFVVEEWDNYPTFGDFVLPFLIGDNFYWLDDYECEGKLTTNDEQGKYFTI